MTGSLVPRPPSEGLEYTESYMRRTAGKTKDHSATLGQKQNHLIQPGDAYRTSHPLAHAQGRHIQAAQASPCYMATPLPQRGGYIHPLSPPLPPSQMLNCVCFL